MSLIYLDNAASTKVDDAVIAEMLPYFSEWYANSESKHHRLGFASKMAILKSVGTIASFFGIRPPETAKVNEQELQKWELSLSEYFVFTSGATESSNLLLKGFSAINSPKAILTSVGEHPAVSETLKELEQGGWEIRYVRHRADGQIDLGSFQEEVYKGVAVVVIQMVNHETGIIQPIPEIARMARAVGAMVFCDASQAIGKIPIDLSSIHADIDALFFSAHKIYGPKGIGCLYFNKDRLILSPQIVGGGHQLGYRSGTLNVPGIVALAKCCELFGEKMASETIRIGEMRDTFETLILNQIPGARAVGSAAPRVPNISAIEFPSVGGENLLVDLFDLAAATGSACSSMKGTGSGLLEVMGCNPNEKPHVVRFSFGRFNTLEEARIAASMVVQNHVRIESETRKVALEEADLVIQEILNVCDANTVISIVAGNGALDATSIDADEVHVTVEIQKNALLLAIAVQNGLKEHGLVCEISILMDQIASSGLFLRKDVSPNKVKKDGFCIDDFMPEISRCFYSIAPEIKNQHVRTYFETDCRVRATGKAISQIAAYFGKPGKSTETNLSQHAHLANLSVTTTRVTKTNGTEMLNYAQSRVTCKGVTSACLESVIARGAATNLAVGLWGNDQDRTNPDTIMGGAELARARSGGKSMLHFFLSNPDEKQAFAVSYPKSSCQRFKNAK